MSVSVTEPTTNFELTDFVLRWRCWPLWDDFPQSLALPVGIVAISSAAGFLASSWAMGVTCLMALCVVCHAYFLPTYYTLNSAGFGRQSYPPRGTIRLVPWYVVRSYAPKASGVVLFRRSDPTTLDALDADFVPYGEEPEQVLAALRYYLRHVKELPGEDLPAE